jgi:hypothetical protein
MNHHPVCVTLNINVTITVVKYITEGRILSDNWISCGTRSIYFDCEVLLFVSENKGFTC